MTTLGEQFGLSGKNIIVDGPVMNGGWIALDDIPGELVGGVYEVRDDGALRELPAEPPPATHPSQRELSMSSHYFDTSTGRPVELADTGIPGSEGLARIDLGDKGTGQHYVGSQANAERLLRYSEDWSANWAASQPPAAPQGYVEVPESGAAIAERAAFLRRAHADGHAQALEARSGVSHYQANDPNYYGDALTQRATLYRHADGSPILGRDGRPQFEDDGAAAGGNRIGPSDARRAAAQLFVDEQTKANNWRRSGLGR